MNSIARLSRSIKRGFYPQALRSLRSGELLKQQTDDKVGQLLLQNHYRTMARAPQGAMPRFTDVGFRQYSQFEEDGILLYIFALIPPRDRTCLEICAGDGIECNSANLVINHGWWGHLFDGNSTKVDQGRAFYARHRDTFLHPPSFDCAWITAENINDLVNRTGLHGAIDLLSLDMDGIDYWAWKALTVVDPTVVVCEILNPIPPGLALTIPYDPNFTVADWRDDFRGASLSAMTKLARTKNYRLVGTNRYGFNAFFVKIGVADEILPEVTVDECACNPYTRRAQSTRWPRVKDRNWVSV